MKLSTGAKAYIAAGSGLLFLFLLFWLSLGHSESHSVCTLCGVRQETTGTLSPFTNLVLSEHSTEKPTALSRALLRSGITSAHAHHWLFLQGSTKSLFVSSCRLGLGRSVESAVDSQQLAQVFESAQRFQQTEFRDKLLRMAFDPSTTELARTIARNAPTNCFADATQFRTWTEQALQRIELDASLTNHLP